MSSTPNPFRYKRSRRPAPGNVLYLPVGLSRSWLGRHTRFCAAAEEKCEAGRQRHDSPSPRPATGPDDHPRQAHSAKLTMPQMRWSPRGAHLLLQIPHPGTQRHPRRRLPTLVPRLHPHPRPAGPSRVASHGLSRSPGLPPASPAQLSGRTTLQDDRRERTARTRQRHRPDPRCLVAG